jgi:hypothetical protein
MFVKSDPDLPLLKGTAFYRLLQDTWVEFQMRKRLNILINTNNIILQDCHSVNVRLCEVHVESVEGLTG